MKVFDHERRKLVGKPEPKAKKVGGSKPDPKSTASIGKSLGFHPSTWRARMRRVERGEITMDEAINTPVGPARFNGSTKHAAK